MARRGMTGQLNMFDFYNSWDEGTPGEVEMVSLVPSYEDDLEPEIEEITKIEKNPESEEVPERVESLEPETEMEPDIEVEPVPVLKTDATIAMSRSYEQDGKRIEIAYINYNKVRITNGDERPVIKEFASTKEAVDFYVQQMQEFEADE